MERPPPPSARLSPVSSFLYRRNRPSFSPPPLTLDAGMGRPRDTNRIDLHRIFSRVQQQMLADLSASEVFDHPTACGAATEQRWLALFNRYLPQRYRSTSAFIIDADGRRSRQIDIAVYDHFYSPLLFHDDSGPHIPAESVYAVFEVKHTLSAKWIADAGRKTASVRALRRTFLSKPPAPILAGILSLDAVWAGPFERRLSACLRRLPPTQRLDLGCCLRRGAFNEDQFTGPADALIYFILRLLHRLQQMGNAPALDLSEYARVLSS